MIILLLSMEGRGSWATMRDIRCMEGFLMIWFGGFSRGGGGEETGCIGGLRMRGCIVWLEVM